MSPTPPPPDWSDERLDAAFNARFDTSPPPELGDRLHGALASSRPMSRLAIPGFRRFAAAGVAAVAVVVVAVLAAPWMQAPLHPSASSGGGSDRTTPGSVPPLPTPVVVGGALPVSITVPGADSPQPVLSVEDALAVLHSDDPGREIVVGGWYEFSPVPCAQVPDATPELESCAVDFTFMWSGPDLLDEPSPPLDSAGNGPGRTGLNIVTAFTDWTPPPSDGRTHAIVVTGHFDDHRASDCPIGQRRTRCARLFVVDAPLWTTAGSLDLSAAPTSAGGHTVMSIADAISVRQSGSTDEVAVVGWLMVPKGGAFSCPFIPATGPTWLEGRCPTSYVWLMAAPEPRLALDANGLTFSPPMGLAVQPAFEQGWSEHLGNGVPNTGWVVPEPAVFIGHFNDPRSSECTGYADKSHDDIVAACRARLVVTSIAWANGSVPPPFP